MKHIRSLVRIIIPTLTLLAVALLSGQTVSAKPTAINNYLSAADGTPQYAVWVDNDGKVGIGTKQPKANLQIKRGPWWTSGFWGSSIGLANGETMGWATNTAGQRAGIGHTDGGFVIFRTASDIGTTGSPSLADFVIDDTGKVGIGTDRPKAKLDITAGPSWTSDNWGSSVALANGQTIGWATNTPGARAGIGHSNDGFVIFRTASDIGTTGSPSLDDFVVDNIGNVGIGTTNPQAKLDVVGTTRTGVLQITGGSDLAENFHSTDSVKPEPGTLMVIDELHEGKLKASTTAYDRKVAGIVSGAGNIKTGLTLEQSSVLDGDLPVTITGRVYCKSEALTSAIQPGDLLTTSDIPGYCMKASDNARANGAIIGKAMTSLKSGKGLVLVLVNLQ